MTQASRRTQQMRSAATRERLLAATLDALTECGYAKTTTADIAARAGVSRGALMHHYASKDSLITTAVERLLFDATAEIRALAEQVEAGRLTLDGFVDHLWRMFSGRLFSITLEHVTECRHNPGLKAKMIPVVRGFHTALDEIWREFFVETVLTRSQVETTLNMTLCLLRGMGVQSVLREDPPYYESLLAGWKQQLSRIVEANHHPRALKRRRA